MQGHLLGVGGTPALQFILPPLLGPLAESGRGCYKNYFLRASGEGEQSGGRR
jgi:hypothetical protein